MNSKLAYSIIFPILVLLFASCSDEPTKGGEEDPTPDGIVYATCDDGKGEGWSEVMTLDGKVLLYRATPKTSTLLITDVDRQGTATTVVDFDERERLVSIIGDDYCLRGEYEGTSDIGKFTLYTADAETYIGELAAADGELGGSSRAGTEFVNFDVPIVNRAIRTYKTIDGIKSFANDPGMFIINKGVDKVVGDFIDNNISNPLSKFAFEAGTTAIRAGYMVIYGEYDDAVRVPIEVAISMYQRGNVVVDILRKRAFRERVGQLNALVSSPIQLDDDTFEFSINVEGVSTIPAEYRGKTIVGLMYKEVAIDDDDTFVDLFDPAAQIILQAAPVADGRFAVNKATGRNKKIILRPFIMPATEVPRWQNGLITRSATSIIGYSEPYIFINVPVSLACRQLDMKGFITTDKSRVVKKEARVSLEFSGRNDAYLVQANNPILDWGVVLYCDGEEQMRFSMVTEHDNPGDTSNPREVTSTQNVTIDASLLDLDYDTFTATSDRWCYGSYVVYYIPYDSNIEVYGSLEPLELNYEAFPEYRYEKYEVGDVRPYDGDYSGLFGNYSIYGIVEGSGMLFVDEVYAMEYFPARGETYQGLVGSWCVDGEEPMFYDNGTYKDWAFGQYVDEYWGYQKMISRDRVFYSANCIHKYCNGTLESFYEGIHPGFPGDLFNYTER